MRTAYNLAAVLGLATLSLIVTGCRTRDNGATQVDPFAITFVKGAGWTQGYQGFDPKLPGYHLTGDIAEIRTRLQSEKLPETIVLAIRTSPAMRPNLESFVLSNKDTVIDTALFNGTGLELVKDPKSKTPAEPVAKVKQGTYFRFAVVGEQVQVTFMPKAMELLREEYEISWIDWYRK